MIEFETTVLEVLQRTHNVKSFRFKVDSDIGFKPGQFFFVTIKVDGTDRTKHFSFSNSPTETGYLEFTKKLTDSDFSKALDRIRPGDWAKVRMPYGKFTFEGEYEKVAFLTGGIGITPFRSICKFAVDKKLPADIVVLYSNRNENDIAFKQDFDEMKAAHNNIRVVYTLTQEEGDEPSWRGRKGRIGDAMIKEEIPDYRERMFYICGPKNMVDAMKELLKSHLDIKDDKIKTENFIGYGS